MESAFKTRMLGNSRLCADTNASFDIYKPNAREILKSNEFRKFDVGNSHSSEERERSFLIVGATGTGKTTFLNAMVNYLLGVESGDNFRFKMVTQEDEGIERATSITKSISAYTFNETILSYPVTIIDTPGFGDTEGLNADFRTGEMIKDALGMIPEIDAVCFVTKASDTRLTLQQRHNFNSALSLFGSDVASNIVIIATFADASEPPVRQALSEAAVPYANLFAFNNGTVFRAERCTDRNASCWEECQRKFFSFFERVRSLKPVSMERSQKVMNIRACLTNDGDRLYELVGRWVNLSDEIKQKKIEIEKWKGEADANRNYTYTVVEKTHFLGIRVDRTEVKRINHEMRGKHVDAVRKHNETVDRIEELTTQCCTKDQEISKKVEEIRSHIGELRSIAIRPDYLLNPDYIDALMKAEEEAANPGREETIKCLQVQRVAAQRLFDLTDPNYDPLRTFKDQSDHSIPPRM